MFKQLFIWFYNYGFHKKVESPDNFKKYMLL